MNKLFKKLFAPIAIFAMALGVSLSVSYQSDLIGANAAGEETGVVTKYNKTTYSSNIADGLLVFGTASNNLKLVGGSATFSVSFAKNDSSTTSIFNNSAGEVRLYGGSTNGGQLTFTISSGFYMKEVTITTSTNNGYKIDGGATITDLVKTTTITNQTSFVIKNVATGTNQVRIVSVSIVYKDSEYVLQTFGTLTSLNIDHTGVTKTFVVGDTFNYSGLVATALDEVNFEKNVTSFVDVDLAGIVFDSSHIGTQVVTVSYSEGPITVNSTYNIEVIPLRLFRKVVSITDLHFGARYIIANEDGTKAMSIVQNSNNRSEVVTTKVVNDIKFSADIQEFSLEIGKVADTFGFKATNGTQLGKYIASSSSSNNYLISSNSLDANGSWLIGISSDTVISSQGSFTNNNLRYNSTSSIFSSYSSSSSVVGKVTLYISEDSIDSTVSAQMFATEVNSGLGNTAIGTCQSTLEILNSAYNRLDVNAKSIVDTSSDTAFVNARARMSYLSAWVSANTTANPIGTPVGVGRNNIITVILIGAMGLSSILAYYFLNKKKAFK